MQRWLPVLFLFLFVGGCYTQPVRHLSSDVALITPGTSTKKDVLLYLGEPDTSRKPAPNIEEFTYHAKHKKGLLRKTPFLGNYLDPNSSQTIIVTLTDGVVTSCDFKMEDKDDKAWADDFKWKEVR